MCYKRKSITKKLSSIKRWSGDKKASFINPKISASKFIIRVNFMYWFHYYQPFPNKFWVKIVDDIFSNLGKLRTHIEVVDVPSL